MRIRVFTVLMSALFITISSSLSAEEKIIGAFGLKFGQTFTPQDAIDVMGDSYQFSPKKKFRSFSAYFVEITPKTHKVHSIAAYGKTEDDSSCEKEQALIVAILQKKYGKAHKDQISLNNLKYIKQGNRGIAIGCTGLGVLITYSDLKLEKLAENERIALESGKVDSSAL